VRRGTANFDRITVKIYKDNTARLEALKAGEFDLMRFFSAGRLGAARQRQALHTGELVKGEFKHRLPTGFQSYVLNTRKRQAARTCACARRWAWRGLRVDEPADVLQRLPAGERPVWQHRLRGHGLPGAAKNWRCWSPGASTCPPRLWPHDGAAAHRWRLVACAPTCAARRPAQGRLGGGRRAAQRKGQAIHVLEYMDSNEGGARVVTPWMRNLEKLGITLRFRPVDFALYQQRLQKFDFDITSLAYQGTHNPGQEYADLFGSKAADTEDSGNLRRREEPRRGRLVSRMTGARTKAELLPACRALERIIATATT
jgi:microcin C transport system substrate-binding protein